MEIYEIRGYSDVPYNVDFTISVNRFKKLREKIINNEVENLNYIDKFPLEFEGLILIGFDYVKNDQDVLSYKMKVAISYFDRVKTEHINFQITEDYSELMFLIIEDYDKHFVAFEDISKMIVIN